MCHPNKWEPPPYFDSDTYTWPHSGPFCWQNPRSVNPLTVELTWLLFLNKKFFQLCSNTKQISYVHKIPKKLCKSHCYRSNEPLSKLHHFFVWCALFQVATFVFFSFWNCFFFLWCICLTHFCWANLLLECCWLQRG